MLVLLMPAEVRRSFMMPFVGYIFALLDEPISFRETDPQPSG
jgi:hypothetical protein